MDITYVMMDADQAYDQRACQGAVHETLLSKQMGIEHMCDHRCNVQPLFGNAYRCESSGQVHVCDANCSQRMYYDRYSTVCRISRKVCASPCVTSAPSKKRSGARDDEPLATDVGCKRGPGAPATCSDASAFHVASASQGDAMVM